MLWTLWRIVRFELRFAFRRPSTWVYGAVYFAFGFLLINAAGGAFRALQVSTADRELVNSPIAIAAFIAILNLFGVIAVGALVGGAAARDFETGTAPLVLTTPVPKTAYLGGRFLGGTAAALLVLTAIPLGVAVGSLMPYLDRERFGPFLAAAYWRPFAILVVPNLVLTATLFFAAAVLFRRGIANHLGAVLLIVGYAIARQLLADIHTQHLAALLDPFGVAPLRLATQYWTIAERNAQMIPFGGLVGLNRCVWLAVAALAWTATFIRFRAAQDPRTQVGRREATPAVAGMGGTVVVPRAIPRFTGWVRWEQLWQMARRDLVELVWRRSFLLLAVAGLVLLLVMVPQVTKTYGTPTYPVTYTILDVLGSAWSLFLLIAITLCAGELVWSERELRIEGIVDALPVPAWVRYGAKLAALTGVVALLQLVVLACGVATQAAHGYYRFELPLYFGQLFGLYFVDAVLVAVLALTVHALANHKYLGNGITFLVLFALPGFLPRAGLEHNLFYYASDGGWTYSDLNGYGHFLGPWAWWKLYWTAVAFLLTIGAVLFWVRGYETDWSSRLAVARKRFDAPTRRVALGAVLAWVGFGGWILYNTNVLNDFETSPTSERRAANFERKYRRFEHAAQPRIVAVSVRADLFPDRRAIAAHGRMTLKNKTAVRVDSIHVVLPAMRHLDVRRLEFSRPAQRVLDDAAEGYRIFRLAAPLEPGDSVDLLFDLAFRPHGFANEVGSGGVVENGTFVTSEMLPKIGYDKERELSDEEARRRQGLPPKRRVPDLYDAKARQNTYVSRDADWIRLDVVVSTSADQIAVAPGRLAREWREGDRRVFHYVQDAPVLNFYGVLSARYAVFRDRWHDVAIEILYHPAHSFNVARIDEAIKKSLAYFTAAFGPYPHRALRIVEFPRYASFAQAFATTIPYSESIGFLARFDPKTNIDYPFYVTAHEVAHQWWAHQVIGGNVQGATMLSETLAQYSALMVMEREYGPSAMRRFLQYELNGYLVGRATETRGEPPLYRVESQAYVHYRKGSLVMYALRDLLGETVTNGALARYMATMRFQAPPYTYTPELLAALRAVTPDSLQYVIGDLFEKIVLYDNRARKAVAYQAGPGRYVVELDMSARKVYADSLGKETSAPMNDFVDIGIYGRRRAADRDTIPLYLGKRRIRGGEQRIAVTVDGEPLAAGIDPDHKLVDRAPDDNTVTVTRDRPAVGQAKPSKR